MKHYILTVALLCVATGGRWAIEHARESASRNRAVLGALEIPDRIGAYQQVGQDVDPGDKVRAMLETSDVLMRTYASPSRWPVELTIVYAGATRRSLHFPEVCLVGGGWEIREQYTDPVGFLFAAKCLVLVKGNQSEAVLYWFKTGNKLTGNFFLNSWYWACNQLTFSTPTSALIKLTTPIGPQGEEAAFTLLEDFAEKLTPEILERVP